jgi:hypothetical protein
VFVKFPKLLLQRGRAVYSKYNITISIPLNAETMPCRIALRAEIVQSNVKQLTELDSLVYKKYNNPEFESHLNIPFRIVIMQFDGALNRVGSNPHKNLIYL